MAETKTKTQTQSSGRSHEERIEDRPAEGGIKEGGYINPSDQALAGDEVEQRRKQRGLRGDYPGGVTAETADKEQRIAEQMAEAENERRADLGEDIPSQDDYRQRRKDQQEEMYGNSTHLVNTTEEDGKVPLSPVVEREEPPVAVVEKAPAKG